MLQPFNIAHIEPSSFIYGPGERFVIWVQGCTLGCQGCWNRLMLSKRPKQLIAREALLDKILDLDSIQGVTLLGGEPLQQLSNVLWLLQQVKSAGLDTMVFTGYECPEITNDDKSNILPFTDILVSGRYVAARRNINLQWRGSSNQQVHFPTGQYDASLIKEGNYVEVHFEADGRMRILGFPDADIMAYENG
ncbi:MAG TPA: radical SAM protein [Thiotrichaceae bacterium]|nr:radical SAM protein [Thiotrichaceae bacterium]